MNHKLIIADSRRAAGDPVAHHHSVVGQAQNHREILFKQLHQFTTQVYTADVVGRGNAGPSAEIVDGHLLQKWDPEAPTLNR